MHVRSLLSVLFLCSMAYGCATPPNEPAAAQSPRPDPEIRTGTRLPGNNSSATGTVSRDDWQNDRMRGGASASRQ